jgi:hypothetical protein
VLGTIRNLAIDPTSALMLCKHNGVKAMGQLLREEIYEPLIHDSETKEKVLIEVFSIAKSLAFVFCSEIIHGVCLSLFVFACVHTLTGDWSASQLVSGQEVSKGLQLCDGATLRVVISFCHEWHTYVECSSHPQVFFQRGKCVCVCVREREKEKEKERQRQGGEDHFNMFSLHLSFFVAGLSVNYLCTNFAVPP